VEEIFNFWVPKLEKLNFASQKNKSLMSFVAIICINPQSQNEKVKANINHVINGLLGLVKQFKNRAVSSDKEAENNDDHCEEEAENKFNVRKKLFLYLIKK